MSTTIVTAFTDIGRGEWEGIKNGHVIPHYIKRDTETYFKRFERLTKLKNPIVCFTETRFFERIRNMRSDIVLVDIDNVWEENSALLNDIHHIQNNTSFIKYVNTPASPEYWSPKYVLVNFLKSFFVDHAVTTNIANTNDIAWIDFGYCRDEVYCPEGMTWVFDTGNKINLFCQNINTHSKPIFEIVRTGEVYIQGCHIIAPRSLWVMLRQLVTNSIISLINVGLIDDDQTMLLMAYKTAPEYFNLIPSDPNNWFTVFEGRCNG